MKATSRSRKRSTRPVEGFSMTGMFGMSYFTIYVGKSMGCLAQRLVNRGRIAISNIPNACTAGLF
jgi:hypothetical protein